MHESRTADCQAPDFLSYFLGVYRKPRCSLDCPAMPCFVVGRFEICDLTEVNGQRHYLTPSPEAAANEVMPEEVDVSTELEEGLLAQPLSQGCE